MKLKDKTKSLITMIYLNYFCDETQKKNTQLILKNNEEKYQKALREKYNPDNIFDHKQKERFVEEKEVITDEMAMVEYKESIFRKIINKILKIFQKK